MSSWKKAVKTGRRVHQERHQLESRQHLGILEKKQDYRLRAKDYNEKKAALKLLKKRALNKNPDEFYFHMINSVVKKDVHREKKKIKEHSEEQLKLMDTQNLKYISFKRNLEVQAIEKLQSKLHAIDAANNTVNKHIFFVDDVEKPEKFDVAAKLGTHPMLLDRKTNRIKLDKLKKMGLPEVDKETLAKIEQQKQMAYSELRKRIERERELTIVQQKLEMKKALKDPTVKKPKVIRGASKDAAPVYKWNFQRKK